jgi:hypothetical protein
MPRQQYQQIAISADSKSNGGPFLVPRLVIFALRMCLAAGMPSEASNR